MGAEGAASLGTALQTNQTLTELNLWWVLRWLSCRGVGLGSRAGAGLSASAALLQRTGADRAGPGRGCCWLALCAWGLAVGRGGGRARGSTAGWEGGRLCLLSCCWLWPMAAHPCLCAQEQPCGCRGGSLSGQSAADQPDADSARPRGQFPGRCWQGKAEGELGQERQARGRARALVGLCPWSRAAAAADCQASRGAGQLSLAAH